MFKLIAVGGRLRGHEIILNEGENTIGRSPECDHILEAEGVSKKHLRITVNGEGAYLEDLGSSNGTILNGKLIQKQSIYNQDKIALPNAIFQVVFVRENVIKVVKKVAKGREGADINLEGLDHEEPPKDFPGKIRFFFKTKVMSVFYSFNQQYEWRVMVGIVMAIFIAVNIILIMQPVLRTNQAILKTEIAKRAIQYVDEVARYNNVALRDKNIDRIDTSFLETSGNGIESYELFDKEGRIVRPRSKLNTYTNDPFSTEVLDVLGSGRSSSYQVKSLGSKIGVGLAITASDLQRGREEIVGYIAIVFAPVTLTTAAQQEMQSYGEAALTSFLVAIIFFGIIYYLTRRPLDELRLQIEQVQRGRKKEIESRYLMEEINPLRKSVNTILQRVRELQKDESSDFQELEEDSSYVQVLSEFLRGAQGAVMILNSEKLIQYINPIAEDLIGLRESSASGMSLLDTARDQGFAATVIDLCDQSSNAEGTNVSDVYEIGGREHQVHVVALMGKDGFAKAFYVTFVEE